MKNIGSKAVIQALLEIDSVCVAELQPFFYTSGWASPIYLDTKGLFSDIARRSVVLNAATNLLKDFVQKKRIDAIVGIEGSGVPFAAWLADRLDMPFLYLRKRPIGWGIKAQIEGNISANARVLVIDDVTTDAKSKVDACIALRNHGAMIEDIFVLVNFDIYPQSESLLSDANLEIHSLVTWRELFAQLSLEEKLTKEKLKLIEDFNKDPITWSASHGGIGKC